MKILQASKSAAEETTEVVTELQASSSAAVPLTTTTASTTRTTEPKLETKADINGHQRPSTDVGNGLEERTSEFRFFI